VSYWRFKDDNGQGTENSYSRFALEDTSRLGARVKAGKVKGRFEFGLRRELETRNGDKEGTVVVAGTTITGLTAANAYKDNQVAVRHFFGEWDFGAGSLLVGHTTTPVYFGLTSMAGQPMLEQFSESFAYMGSMYDGRNGQVALKMKGFTLAFIHPEAIEDLKDVDTGSNWGGSPEFAIPKIALGYTFKWKSVGFKVAGGYQVYDLEKSGSPDVEVKSWVIGANAEVKLGPVDVGGTLGFAENGEQYGMLWRSALDSQIQNNTVKDTKDTGWNIYGGWKLNDMVWFGAGYGYTDSEFDDKGQFGLPSGKAKDITYYLQSIITMAPGVFLVPEIGRWDRKQGTDGKERGEKDYYGIKFQINF
jgi:hypothetical protein